VPAVNRPPIPRIDELINQVRRAKYLSTLQLSQGYHQVALDEETVPKTAFIAMFGKYGYLKLLFGLNNAPAYFRRLMDQALVNHPSIHR
jgi:hypothetical protein